MSMVLAADLPEREGHMTKPTIYLLRVSLFTLFSAHFLVADCATTTLWNSNRSLCTGFRCNPCFR
jgi:hypothetical protein